MTDPLVIDVARMLAPEAYDDPSKGAFERAHTYTAGAAAMRFAAERIALKIIEKVRDHRSQEGE